MIEARQAMPMHPLQPSSVTANKDVHAEKHERARRSDLDRRLLLFEASSLDAYVQGREEMIGTR